MNDSKQGRDFWLLDTESNLYSERYRHIISRCEEQENRGDTTVETTSRTSNTEIRRLVHPSEGSTHRKI
jgi:hypothetical protein